MSAFPGEEQDKTVAMLHALKDGLGVEDMEVMGICEADYARKVIARLRDMDVLQQWVRPRRKP